MCRKSWARKRNGSGWGALAVVSQMAYTGISKRVQLTRARTADRRAPAALLRCKRHARCASVKHCRWLPAAARASKRDSPHTRTPRFCFCPWFLSRASGQGNACEGEARARQTGGTPETRAICAAESRAGAAASAREQSLLASPLPRPTRFVSRFGLTSSIDPARWRVSESRADSFPRESHPLAYPAQPLRL